MIKVLQFAPGFSFGGIESRMLDWYRNINREKVHFDLLKQSNNSNFTTNIEQLEQLGVNVFNVPQFKYYNIISYCRAIDLFFSRDSSYSVVHSHSVTTGLFVLYYAKKYGVRKRILHSRTTKFDGSGFRKIFLKIMNYLARSYATDFFACSQQAGEFAFGHKIKFTIINNGIELNKFRFDFHIREKIREELNLTYSFVIGSVCRFTTPKNIPFLIDIVLRIIDRESNTKLLLVGDGPLKNYIENRFIEVGLRDNLVLVGKKDNVWDYYFSMDIFLSPSIWEGFGTTVIEAQATGLPCVVSESFPSTTKISKLMFRLSLSNSADFWAKEILGMKNIREKQTVIEQIANAGFDAVKIAKELEKIYQS